MKNFKNLWLLLIAAPLMFGQLGCKKFLDRKPLSQGIEGDIKQGGVEAEVFGLYAATRNWGMTSLPFMSVHGARSDDAYNSTPGDDGGSIDMYDNFKYVKDNWLQGAVWDDHFAFITQANNIIQKVDSLYANDPASLINKAEAKLLRAYAYFDLVRDFGDVPKIDFKVYKPEDANIPKSNASEIYALIDEDLQYAAQYLPLFWDAAYLGRVTKGTANTLQAKANLYRKNWAGALSKCEEIISSAQYELYPRYGGTTGLFTEVAENSKESIFEIQNYANANGSVFYTNDQARYNGVRGSGEWDLGWGWNLPSAELVANGYEANDPRKGATILFSGQPDNLYGVTLPPLTSSLYWNKKVYTDPTRRGATGDRFGQWLNTPIIRYADVLLMAAEAANETGTPANIAKALGWLEMIRNRARAGDNAVLPPVTTTDQSELRTAIKKERRAEFAMEFERFYDLVRWIPASDNIDAINVLGTIGYTAKNKVLPIPQGAIDKSKVNNVQVLVQNPDY
jgi:starch-binding outer membrane protein, SusD/RagB family